jgi:hypothetical protein
MRKTPRKRAAPQSLTEKALVMAGLVPAIHVFLA